MVDVNTLPESFLKHGIKMYLADNPLNSVSGKKISETILYYAVSLKNESGTIKLLTKFLQNKKVGVTNIDDKDKMNANADYLLTHCRILGDITVDVDDVQLCTWEDKLPVKFRNGEFYVMHDNKEIFRDLIGALHNPYAATKVDDDFRSIPSCPVIYGGKTFDFIVDSANDGGDFGAASVNMLIQFRALQFSK